MSTNVQRASRVEKQLRRIECRRRERGRSLPAPLALQVKPLLVAAMHF